MIRRALFLVSVVFSAVAFAGPIDPSATPETRALFENLRDRSGKGILFGHQNANLEGVGWTTFDSDGESAGLSHMTDVRAVSGEDPAVFGFDFFSLDSKNSGDVAADSYAKS